ncbi:hypothetical protein SAMN05216567_105437 [Variovorax sp. OK605]|jgi:hypothetical protein|uniref:hypothetical protein n=1 Tax=unclassified Variovorax TaxID=663243 RepID=UPI0008B628F5|nr:MULTISPECIES: hypothetical protein [unclassified Variovorax]SEJ43557.1 hypothetical protein SAMN05518853_10227 [Variovorax sp. OK202]SFC41623.1 hypothetical protein SAMN05444746_10227 [Variovorax sp. OK212]SFP34074.1 hypothetical protein SAMN05216567_105437 [Variovorax sp. OK605]
MNSEASAFGHDFSKWARLTERYAEEVEALRRREPGASMRLMQIGHALKHHQDPFGSGLLGSQYAALAATMPPRFAPPKVRGPAWRVRVRDTLRKLRQPFRGESAHPAPEDPQPPAA